jgi:hypothetical protein
MTKNKKQNREQKKRKKTILEKEMRFVFFFQTSKLHLIKQKYIFLIIIITKHIRKTTLKRKMK